MKEIHIAKSELKVPIEFSEDVRGIKLHKNTDSCPLIYEVVPGIGCEFQCIYCNALGQENDNQFLPVRIDEKYYLFLEQEILKNCKKGIEPLYYFSPKNDCFQRPFLSYNVTKPILEIFKKYSCNYIIVTKGYPTDEVFQLLIETKKHCQVIVSHGMPDENFRIAIEPLAVPLYKRLELAEKCVKQGIDTALILEPILPLDDLTFVFQIMNDYNEIGINHYAIDFARISHASYNKLIEAIPEYKNQLYEHYFSNDSNIETFMTARKKQITRYAPSKKYLIAKFNEIKEYAKKINSTVSVCNSFKFDTFNIEANQKGYICMGINTNKFFKKKN